MEEKRKNFLQPYPQGYQNWLRIHCDVVTRAQFFRFVFILVSVYVFGRSVCAA